MNCAGGPGGGACRLGGRDARLPAYFRLTMLAHSRVSTDEIGLAQGYLLRGVPFLARAKELIAVAIMGTAFLKPLLRLQPMRVWRTCVDRCADQSHGTPKRWTPNSSRTVRRQN